jgi:hypothetical protein
MHSAMKFTNINSGIPLFFSIMLLFGVFSFSSCGGDGGDDPEPTAGEKVLINLVASQWKVKSVTVDGADKSSLFPNLSITFVSSASVNGKPTAFSGTFTTVNGGSVWPALGNWNINDIAVGSKLTRSDGLEIQLTEVTETSLKMSLAWNKTTIGPGRVESVKGQHIFSMGK